MTDLPTVPPPEPPYAPPPVATEAEVAPARRRGPSKARRFGDALGNLIGQALGFLVGFPLLIGLLAAGGAYLVADDAYSWEQVFVGAAGVGFLIGLLMLAFLWFGQLFLRFWPIILVVVGIWIAVKAVR